MTEQVQVKYVSPSALPNLIRWGWVDSFGRELTWRYWQRLRKRYPFIWVPDDEEQDESPSKFKRRSRQFGRD